MKPQRIQVSAAWVAMVIDRLPDECVNEDLTKAILNADEKFGIERPKAALYSKQYSIAQKMRQEDSSCLFEKGDRNGDWKCIIVDRDALKAALLPKHNFASAAKEPVGEKPKKEEKKKDYTELKEQFLIAFKIFRYAVREAKWKREVFLSYDNLRLATLKEELEDFHTREIFEASVDAVVKHGGVYVAAVPNFREQTVCVVDPAVTLESMCKRGHELYPEQMSKSTGRELWIFKDACDKSYEYAKKNLDSYWEERLAQEEQHATKEATVEETEPDFIKLYESHSDVSRQVVLKIQTLCESEIMELFAKSTVVLTNAEDKVYCIQVSPSWEAELEMMKFMRLLKRGKEDRVYAGFELLEELERKANALEAYCLKKISAEFEKKGL